MVAKIRQLHAEFGVSGSAIAQQSGVSYHIIRHIISGRTSVISKTNEKKVAKFVNKLHDATDI
jgi:hypothetical protein